MGQLILIIEDRNGGNRMEHEITRGQAFWFEGVENDEWNTVKFTIVERPDTVIGKQTHYERDQIITRSFKEKKG